MSCSASLKRRLLLTMDGKLIQGATNFPSLPLYEQVIYHLLPTGIGERNSQPISIAWLVAFLRWCELPLQAECWTNSGGHLYQSLLWGDTGCKVCATSPLFAQICRSSRILTVLEKSSICRPAKFSENSFSLSKKITDKCRSEQERLVGLRSLRKFM